MLGAMRSGEDADHKPGGEPDELMQIPEVREQMEKMLFDHWNKRSWVNLPVRIKHASYSNQTYLGTCNITLHVRDDWSDR